MMVPETVGEQPSTDFQDGLLVPHILMEEHRMSVGMSCVPRSSDLLEHRSQKLVINRKVVNRLDFFLRVIVDSPDNFEKQF
jgi:hypothetical protein